MPATDKRNLPERADRRARPMLNNLAHKGRLLHREAVLWKQRQRARVWPALPRPATRPTVSIIAHAPDAETPACARGTHLQAGTDYPAWEIIPIAAATRQIHGRPARLNQAARDAQGELLLFLDTRMTPRQPSWLSDWVRFAQRPRLGATGPLVLYPHGTIKDAGLHLGVETVAGPPHRHADPRSPHEAGHPGHARYVTAVSAQALLIRRELFLQLGGFDEAFLFSFFDVAFGLRLQAAGWPSAVTPRVVLQQDVSCFNEEPFHHADANHLIQRVREMNLQADPWLHDEVDILTHPPRRRTDGAPGPGNVLELRIRQITDAIQPETPLDIFSNEAVNAQLADTGLALPPPQPAPAPAPDADPEARAWQRVGDLLYRLRSSPQLRARFPRALSGGAHGDFARWLESPDSAGDRQAWGWDNEPGHSAAIFSRHPAHRIRRIFMWRQDIHRFFPLALLPEGRTRWLRWLLEFGRSTYGLREEEIWWFLLETAEAPNRELAYTWHLLPEWQQACPEALTPSGYPAFLNWVQATFGLEPTRFQPLVSPARGEPPPADGQPGVNILGHLMLPCGLQYSVLAAMSALREQGVACSPRDIPGREIEEPPGRENFLGTEVHDLSLIYLPPVTSLENWYARAGLAPRAGVRRIGNWYWEFPEVPEHWRPNARGYSEIWAPSRFIRDALARALTIPVYDMPPGVEVHPVDCTRAEFGLPSHGTLFLFMFDFCSILERKNPLGLIEAFRRAFRPGEPAHLVIKSIRGAEFPDQFARLQAAAHKAGVHLINGALSRERALGLMTLCDAYVSLHRSEGFGLTMAEAMLLGKPVIATGYSGNLDFMHQENSRLVGYRLIPTVEANPPYEKGWTWADPDLDEAARHMRWVHEQPAEAAAMARRGQADATALLSMEAYGRRLAARLRAAREEAP